MEGRTSTCNIRVQSFCLCRFFSIFFAHFLCRCCCGRVSYVNKVNVEEGYEIKNWKLFINKESIPITQDDLHNMRQKYINSCYNHKYYCFKNARERCNHLQCFHYETIKWKGLVKHPVLYLLVLNFYDAKKICKEIIAIRTLKTGNKNWFYNENSPLDFIFKLIVNQNVQANYTELRYTEGSLDNRINNICLVLEDFPREYISNFQDEEKLILEKILTLHHSYKVPLMYSVR